MIRYLSLEQVLDLAGLALGHQPAIRDLGLLDSAMHRPQAAMFGQEAYPDLFEKAAALLQSLVLNHALVDGNKRLGWTATDVFLRYNDVVLEPAEDAAYELVVSVASGEIDEVKEIADVLRAFVRSG